MSKIRVGINGFGRIGRGFARSLAADSEKFDLALINDLTDAKTLAHLCKYDSIHGRYPGNVESSENSITLGKDKVLITKERDPANIPVSYTHLTLPTICSV